MLPSLNLPPDPPRRDHSFSVGDSVGIFPALHVVYVHGFRGDHTSFQRFPTDLHYTLDPRIPSLETHVYPTYKSRKALQVSVERFIKWLTVLEPGFIILIGHSLGGFVVAEAAMQYPRSEGGSRVIGVIAMDVPYLGIHPHVIVSGIISLFPNNKSAESEAVLNDTSKVNVLKPAEADAMIGATPSPVGSDMDASSIRSGSSSSSFKLADLTPGPTAWQNTVHFFRKHSQDPLGAMREWVVSHWEHGSMLLDPDGLKARYGRFEAWKDGEWINYYTETVPGASRNTTPGQSSGLPSQPVPVAGFREPSPPVPDSNFAEHLKSQDADIHFPVPHPLEAPVLLNVEAEGQGTNTKEPRSTYDPSLADQDGEFRFPVPEPAPFTPLTMQGIAPFIPPNGDGHDSDTSSRSRDTNVPKERSDSRPQTPPQGALQASRSTPERSATRTSSDSIRSSPPRTASTPGQPRKRDQVAHHLKRLSQTIIGAAIERQRNTEGGNKNPQPTDKSRSGTDDTLPIHPPEPPRHFIILPDDKMASKTHWQRVPVAGSPHEVDAHCAIFFKDKNWEYDAFIDRVATWIVKVCQKHEKAREVLAY